MCAGRKMTPSTDTMSRKCRSENVMTNLRKRRVKHEWIPVDTNQEKNELSFFNLVTIYEVVFRSHQLASRIPRAGKATDAISIQPRIKHRYARFGRDFH